MIGREDTQSLPEAESEAVADVEVSVSVTLSGKRKQRISWQDHIFRHPSCIATVIRYYCAA